MTADQLIDAILEKEGGFVNDPVDRGGATHYGITAGTLGQWRHYGRPATVEEVRALPIDEARAIYRQRYVAPFESIPFEALQAQLVDFGVLSGPATAVRALQGVLGVEVDGVLGDQTRAAVAVMPWRLVNAALVAARVKQHTELVERLPAQRKFLFGWIRRAISFMT